MSFSCKYFVKCWVRTPFNRLVSNYPLMVTNKRTETRLRGIKQTEIEIIPFTLVSFILFLTVVPERNSKLANSNQFELILFCFFFYGK